MSDTSLAPMRFAPNIKMCTIDADGCYVDAPITVWIVSTDGVSPSIWCKYSDIQLKALKDGRCYLAREAAETHFKNITTK